jgi:hypothetical protein
MNPIQKILFCLLHLFNSINGLIKVTLIDIMITKDNYYTGTLL